MELKQTQLLAKAVCVHFEGCSDFCPLFDFPTRSWYKWEDAVHMIERQYLHKLRLKTYNNIKHV